MDEVLTKYFEGFIYMVHQASDDLIKEFNQSAILIQANETTTEFYSGVE